MICRNYHLLSYPRSGNHILRGVIEKSTRKGTFGCPYSDTDKSLFVNHGSQFYKSHFIKEVALREFRLGGEWGLILLVRNPLECISSQVARSFAYKNPFLAKYKKKVLDDNIEHYISLVQYYDIYRGIKECFFYEDLFKERRVTLGEFDLVFGDEALLNETKNKQNSFDSRYLSSRYKVVEAIKEHAYYDVLMRCYESVR